MQTKDVFTHFATAAIPQKFLVASVADRCKKTLVNLQFTNGKKYFFFAECANQMMKVPFLVDPRPRPSSTRGGSPSPYTQTDTSEAELDRARIFLL
jgi:hypothetical protein